MWFRKSRWLWVHEKVFIERRLNQPFIAHVVVSVSRLFPAWQEWWVWLIFFEFPFNDFSSHWSDYIMEDYYASNRPNLQSNINYNNNVITNKTNLNLLVTSNEEIRVPVVRVVKRRTTANKKERRRTQSINSAYSSLREHIPNVPSDTKLSKVSFVVQDC